MNKSPIKPSVELCCSVLLHFNIHINPEAIRQAKSGDSSVSWNMWLTIHKVTVLIVSKFQKTNVEVDEFNIPWWTQLYLRRWGCPIVEIFNHVFVHQENDRFIADGIDSLSLLLVLGWLIAKANLFDKFYQAELSRAHIDIECMDPGPFPWSPLVLTIPEIAIQMQHGFIHDETLSNRDLNGRHLVRYCNRIKQLLGMIEHTVETLNTLEIRHDALCIALVKAQKTSRSSTRVLNPFELHLLKNPEILDLVERDIAQVLAALQKVQSMKELENRFWQWMNSLVPLQQINQTGSTHRNSFFRIEANTVEHFLQINRENAIAAGVWQGNGDHIPSEAHKLNRIRENTTHQPILHTIRVQHDNLMRLVESIEPHFTQIQTKWQEIYSEIQSEAQLNRSEIMQLSTRLREIQTQVAQSMPSLSRVYHETFLSTKTNETKQNIEDKLIQDISSTKPSGLPEDPKNLRTLSIKLEEILNRLEAVLDSKNSQNSRRFHNLFDQSKLRCTEDVTFRNAEYAIPQIEFNGQRYSVHGLESSRSQLRTNLRSFQRRLTQSQSIKRDLDI